MRTAAIALVAVLLLVAACGKAPPAQEPGVDAPTVGDVQDVEGQLNDIDNLTQELDDSELQGLEQDLAQI